MSGSTLLAGVIRQNSHSRADMSGPAGGLFNSWQGGMSGRNAYSVFITGAQRRQMLEGLSDEFYAEQYAPGVVFDTHRIWCTELRLLKVIYLAAKVTACVRQMPWIIDSSEQLVRKSAFQPSGFFSYQPGAAVYLHVEGLANGEGMGGFAYDALKEACYSEDTAKLMPLKFETLVDDPANAAKAIDAFIGEPVFKRATRTSATTPMNSTPASACPADMPCATILRRVSASRAATGCLRPFENDAFWRDPSLNPRVVGMV